MARLYLKFWVRSAYGFPKMEGESKTDPGRNNLDGMQLIQQKASSSPLSGLSANLQRSFLIKLV